MTELSPSAAGSTAARPRPPSPAGTPAAAAPQCSNYPASQPGAAPCHLAVDETVILLTLSLSVTIDTPTKFRVGCSRTTVSSSTASVAAAAVGLQQGLCGPECGAVLEQGLDRGRVACAAGESAVILLHSPVH